MNGIKITQSKTRIKYRIMRMEVDKVHQIYFVTGCPLEIKIISVLQKHQLFLLDKTMKLKTMKNPSLSTMIRQLQA